MFHYLQRDENGMVGNGTRSRGQKSETHTPDIDNFQLPITKPIYYDFRVYERVGWEVTSKGYINPIPYAAAAKIDAPGGFPEIPGSADLNIQESADGLYKVANVFEALIPFPKVKKAYNIAIKNMETRFKELSNTDSEKRWTGSNSKSIIQICEDTVYEIEALIGVIQVFGERKLDDVCGVERIGVFYTFSCYSFHQNFNLNLVMTRWIKSHWMFPFADEKEVSRLAAKYAFKPLAIRTWLANARSMVWQPLLKSDIVGWDDAPTNFKQKLSFKNRFYEDLVVYYTTPRLLNRRSPSY